MIYHKEKALSPPATWYKCAVSDRKYRQRGYMDEGGGEEPRRGRPTGPRPRREGPRGRGLGAPTAEVFRCATCGRQAAAPAAGEFAATCSSCGADLHSCTNCRHFDSSAPLECRRTVPERVGAKAKNNDCELFEAKMTKEFGSDSGRPDDPRAAFDALFKL
jgi:hypothetical protein